MEMIGTQTNLTYSSQCSHHFVHYDNNDKTSLQPAILYLCGRQNIISKCYGRIGHKSDSCIIRGINFTSPSLRQKMN